MKAAVVLPAPEGLTEDLLGKAIYELNKLGTITENSLTGQGAIEVFTIPDDMKPLDSPADLPFLRFVADLIPYSTKGL